MKYLRDLEDGYVLVMSLLLLPAFLGFGLILIDIGRGNNAQADLQAIADSMALTGARELDGRATQIDDARAAMTQLTNPLGMLVVDGGEVQSITYALDDDRFQVVFLDEIPAQDTTPIDAAWVAAHDAETLGTEPTHVYVRAYSVASFSLELMFDGLFSSLGVPGSYPVGAVAVATADSVICDIPPLFICNPFEFTSGGLYDPENLQTQFSAGNLHGRLTRLHPGGGNTAFPGNFGFLQIDGSTGANDIRDYFAGGGAPLCVRRADTVDTAPGAKTDVATGINIRFDVLPNNYGTQGLEYYPAIAANVRKGFIPGGSGPGDAGFDDCVPNGAGNNSWGDDHVIDLGAGWPVDAEGNPLTDSYTGADGENDEVYGLPDNNVMIHPNSTTGTPGAYIGADSNWPLQTYLNKNYPANNFVVGTSGEAVGTIQEGAVTHNVSSFSGRMPSRYDVYRWEIAEGLNGVRAPTHESGLPNCLIDDHNRQLTSITAVDPAVDPRVMVAAVIDCVQEGEGGSNASSGNTDLTVNTYASFFLARPMRSWSPSADQTIDVEIVDILGEGGRGTLDDLVRTEAYLVR